MTNIPDPHSQPPVQWSDADDRAMDALLKEYFQQQSRLDGSVAAGVAGDAEATDLPRDFTDAILIKLDAQQGSVTARRGQSTAVQPASLPPEAHRGEAAGRARLRGVSRSLAVLAAGVLLWFGVQAWRSGAWNHPARPDQPLAGSEIADHRPSASGSAGPAVDPSIAAGDSAQADAIASQSPHPKARQQPIVLSVDSMPQPDPSANTSGLVAQGDGQPVGGSSSVVTARTANASLRDFDRQFVDYWKSLGVSPAPAVDAATWAKRISDRFGVQPTATPTPSEVAQWFSSDQQSLVLAQRLVNQLGRGLNLSESRREELIASAADVVRTGGRFDRWVSEWVAAEAIANDSAASPTAKAEMLGQWVSAEIVGVDARCARCHDSPIDSRLNQHDYWSFAAVFAPQSVDSLFYEMPDGRQRVAAASAPHRWLGLNDSTAAAPSSIASRGELAQALVGNRQLARSLANHLWEIGFGTPLVSATSSPIAPPRDDSLQRALDILSDTLLSTNFDMRVAARWVVLSEPMRRGTPAELQGDGWRLASESQLAAASLAQRSFAAARPPWPTASRNQLLAMMESRGIKHPSKLGPQDSLLAQPIGTLPGTESGKSPTPAKRGTTATKPVEPQDYWWAQWLADREGLRGGWLESLADRDQQVRHAYYAAGITSISESQLQWAAAWLGSDSADAQDRNQSIAKIYWIIQNAR